MRRIAAVLLVLVNLISSGLVEFAINSCCESEEINCCVPPLKKNESTFDDLLKSDGCCCTDTESHFYYITAKFQNTDKQDDSKSSNHFVITNHRSQLLVDNFGNAPYCSNKFLDQFKLRKKVPPSLLVQYDVWII
jgi:hypothetical protein